MNVSNVIFGTETFSDVCTFFHLSLNEKIDDVPIFAFFPSILIKFGAFFPKGGFEYQLYNKSL